MLIQTDDVAAGIAKAGGDLGRVGADGLNDYTSVGNDSFNGFGDAVDHDVKKKTGIAGGRAPSYPGAAHFADAVVKSEAAVAARADVPSKNLFIESGGAGYVGGGYFQIADFAIGEGWRHPRSVLTGV